MRPRQAACVAVRNVPTSGERHIVRRGTRRPAAVRAVGMCLHQDGRAQRAIGDQRFDAIHALIVEPGEGARAVRFAEHLAEGAHRAGDLSSPAADRIGGRADEHDRDTRFFELADDVVVGV